MDDYSKWLDQTQWQVLSSMALPKVYWTTSSATSFTVTTSTTSNPTFIWGWYGLLKPDVKFTPLKPHRPGDSDVAALLEMNMESLIFKLGYWWKPEEIKKALGEALTTLYGDFLFLPLESESALQAWKSFMGPYGVGYESQIKPLLMSFLPE